MRFIESFREGMHVSDVYLCKNKQIALTKAGKEYGNLLLQDKTGTIDGKIWDLGSPGISNFETMDYVFVDADVTVFQNNYQLNIKRIRKASEDEYMPGDYLPLSSKDVDQMYGELMGFVKSIKNSYMRRLAESFFVDDKEFIKEFRFHSAAKSVHHGFVGGLLEHTLSVVKLCDYYASYYPMINRDLLLCGAMFHDIGKLRELSSFPENDYTDDGQLLGHIIMGTEMVSEKIKTIPDFPPKAAAELKHCILAHHGELEYGSPKKPALLEALALNLADNTDAKIETMMEALKNGGDNRGWLGFNRLMDSNIRRTTEI
ncbi:MAG TPA: HD domain-containing protein [Candidatus Hungatella pullicola]|nr:HD domain-containing protein [Candidatus Hungatella pullicola]